MKTVKVKTINPNYEGYVRGFKFSKGHAEVPEKDAEAMKEFGIEVIEVEKPKAPEKPKKPRKKAGE